MAVYAALADSCGSAEARVSSTSARARAISSTATCTVGLRVTAILTASSKDTTSAGGRRTGTFSARASDASINAKTRLLLIRHHRLDSRAVGDVLAEVERDQLARLQSRRDARR